MSDTGEIEETIVEKEIEEPAFIPSMIRRMSAIDSLITGARALVRQNSLQPSENGHEADHLERKHSQVNMPFTQIDDYRRKRRQTLQNIETISEEENGKN